MKNVLVITNPYAGRKQAVKYKKQILNFLLKNSEEFKFISIDDFSNENLESFDTIFAIGGDGTINKIIQSIAGTDKILGIIPTGTANLLAAKLDLSMNLNKNLKIFEQNNTKEIDLIEINQELSILRIGFGYDSDIICKTPQSLKNKFGYFAYFIAGIIFALRLKSKTYNFKYDNTQLITEATCVIVANAPNMYRKTITLGNNSELDDELFDVFILKAKNPITFFLEFLKILFGIRKNNKLALYFKASQITIDNEWINCHIDGEKKNIKNKINIKISDKKVKLLCK